MRHCHICNPSQQITRPFTHVKDQTLAKCQNFYNSYTFYNLFSIIFVLKVFHFDKYLACYAQATVKCPLGLSHFHQNWNASTNFSRAPQYQVSLQFLKQFSGSYMCTDRHNEADRYIHASFVLSTLKPI